MSEGGMRRRRVNAKRQADTPRGVGPPPPRQGGRTRRAEEDLEGGQKPMGGTNAGRWKRRSASTDSSVEQGPEAEHPTARGDVARRETKAPKSREEVRHHPRSRGSERQSSRSGRRRQRAVGAQMLDRCMRVAQEPGSPDVRVSRQRCQRQEGNERSDAPRLLARESLRRVLRRGEDGECRASSS